MPTLRMNGANSLSIFIIVTLLLSIFTWAPWAQAAEHDYREDLTIFAVGSVGYWRLGFHGGNITLSGLSSIESEASGVEAYSLFAARSRQWSPSYEYFTDRGFSVLDYNLIPTEGMILTVNANSAENAQRFASQLGPIIEGSFTPIDFGLGNFTFYSHTDFTRLVNKYLRGSIPFYYGGFASLVDQNSYADDPLPMFIFKGERDGSSVAHSIILAGIRNETISNTQFRLENLFENASTASTSNFSSSSSINIVLQGSLVSSSGGSSFINDPEKFKAVFQANFSKGSPLPSIEATVIDVLPVLSATRAVDLGAPRTGQTVEVRVRVQHLSGQSAPPVTEINIREDWWTGAFDKVDGTTETVVPRLAPGDEFNMIYQLRATADGPTELTPSLAQNIIPYQYAVGDRTVTDSVSMNPLTIRLNSLNPTISAEANVSTANPSASANTATTLVVKNIGDRTAFQLMAYLDGDFVRDADTLTPGGTWTVSGEIPSKRLTSISNTVMWRVTYIEEGNERSVESNPIRIFYRFDSPAVPNVRLEKKAELRKDGETQYAQISITASNHGPATSRLLTINDTVPLGTTLVNTTLSRDVNALSAVVAQLESGDSMSYDYWLQLAPDTSYVIPPAQGTTEIQGAPAKTLSNSATLPSGIHVDRNISLTKGFVGSVTTIQIQLVNRGDLSASDIEINTENTPGELVSGNTSRTADTLRQGDSVETGFQTRLTRQGSYNASAILINLYLSGQKHTIKLPAAGFQVNEPVKLSFTTDPIAPVEKKPFKILFTVTNPSDLPVEKVNLTVNLPSAIQMIEGSPSFEIPGLDAGDTFKNEVTLVGERALRFEFEPSLTFTYAGQQIPGQTDKLAFNVDDDVTTRYLWPIGTAIAVIIVVAGLLRRMIVTQPSMEVGSKPDKEGQ